VVTDVSDTPKKIIIYGAGGLGREILQIVRATLCLGGARVLGFVDDGVPPGTIRNDAEILGGGEYLDALSEPCSVVIGFADPKAKAETCRRLRDNPMISYPNIIHPSASVSGYASLGEGVVISPDCVVSIDAKIGNFVFLNYRAMIGHDSTVGSFTSVMPSVAVSGNVEIGERCMLGVGSLILQGVKITAGAMVGMGSVVLSDVSGDTSVFGNPARRVQ
jgi:sugar O-acyltransferase (sialic acid O-acetyltransferase NeuD family)